MRSPDTTNPAPPSRLALLQAISAFMQGDPAVALDKLAATPVVRDHTASLQAYLLTEHGKFPDAVALFKKVAEANPKQPEALFRLGLSAALARNWPLAAESWRSVSLSLPDEPIPLICLALALIRAGDPGAAASALDQAAALDADLPMLHLAQAAIYIASGDFGKASAAATRLSEAGFAVDPFPSALAALASHLALTR